MWLKLNEKALELKERFENEKHEKALELADILKENPNQLLAYDWYQGEDTDIQMIRTRYIIVSRLEIIEIQTANFSDKPESEMLEGFFKYDIDVVGRIEKIKTSEKEYELRRP